MTFSRKPPACVPLTLPNLKAEEEVRELQKKMQQLENDLDQTQEKLMNANQRLEEKEKALQNVSTQCGLFRLRRRWRPWRKRWSSWKTSL